VNVCISGCVHVYGVNVWVVYMCYVCVYVYVCVCLLRAYVIVCVHLCVV
jgi:hypothetical protein